MVARRTPFALRPAVACCAAFLVALLALLPAAASYAAEGAATMRFLPIGVFLFELDGEVLEDAEIYHSPEAAAILVMAPELPHPIAVVPRNQTVQRLAAADLHKEGGVVTWSSKGEKTAIGEYRLVDNKPRFDLAGKEARFLDKPPLLGPTSIEDIVEYDASYRYRADQYEPQPVYMGELEKLSSDVLVKVYFSTQCKVCQELLPHMIKVIEELDNPNFSFEFFGLPLPATGHPVAEEMNVKGFPTGIVFIDGREVGRAEGHRWRFPSMALHHIIRGISVDPEELITRE